MCSQRRDAILLANHTITKTSDSTLLDKSARISPVCRRVAGVCPPKHKSISRSMRFRAQRLAHALGCVGLVVGPSAAVCVLAGLGGTLAILRGCLRVCSRLLPSDCWAGVIQRASNCLLCRITTNATGAKSYTSIDAGRTRRRCEFDVRSNMLIAANIAVA